MMFWENPQSNFNMGPFTKDHIYLFLVINVFVGFAPSSPTCRGFAG
jgi:hypothetical protein